LSHLIKHTQLTGIGYSYQDLMGVITWWRQISPVRTPASCSFNIRIISLRGPTPCHWHDVPV